MSWLPEDPCAFSPQAYRAELCERFPAYLEKLVRVHDVRIVDFEQSLGVGPSKAYQYFAGTKSFHAAMLPLLPPAIELAIITDRAAHHGRELRIIEDAGEASLLRVISEAGDVLRTAATSEADGIISAKEAREELVQIEELEAALVARKALLKRAIKGNGLSIAGAR
jgi:hypothetical protein